MPELSILAKQSEDSSKLFETLIHVEYSDELTHVEVIDAYMRATCVAANVPFDKAFLQDMPA
jgi:hypothetical protein